MTERRARQGRVFCVTGVKTLNLNPAPSTTNERPLQCSKSQGTSHSDSDSSGYISASSFESTGEERRLILNEGKVFKVWEQWANHLGADFTKVSTPKRDFVDELPMIQRKARASAAINRVSEAGKCTLAIKKTLGESKIEKRNRKHVTTERPSRDCGERVQSVKAKCIYRTCSETDLSPKGKRVTSRESECDTFRRRPFKSLSTNAFVARSEMNLRASGVSAISSEYSEIDTLPAGSIQNGRDETNKTIEKRMSKYCADGRPVDESMTEFLETVNKDNLVSLLNFYDKMTTDSYGRTNDIARRTRQNYEAVYY